MKYSIYYLKKAFGSQSKENLSFDGILQAFVLKPYKTWKFVRASFRKYQEALPETIFTSKVNFEVLASMNLI